MKIEEMSLPELMKTLADYGGEVSPNAYFRLAKLIQLASRDELRAWENALFGVHSRVHNKFDHTQRVEDSKLLGMVQAMVYVLETRYEILREQEAVARGSYAAIIRRHGVYNTLLWELSRQPKDEWVRKEWLRHEIGLPASHSIDYDLGVMATMGYIDFRTRPSVDEVKLLETGRRYLQEVGMSLVRA